MVTSLGKNDLSLPAEIQLPVLLDEAHVLKNGGSQRVQTRSVVTTETQSTPFYFYQFLLYLEVSHWCPVILEQMKGEYIILTARKGLYYAGSFTLAVCVPVSFLFGP